MRSDFYSAIICSNDDEFFGIMDVLVEQIALVGLDDIIARKRGERQYVGCIV